MFHPCVHKISEHKIVGKYYKKWNEKMMKNLKKKVFFFKKNYID